MSLTIANRVLEGNFNRDYHALDFSSPVIELKIAQGDIYEGSFSIYGPENTFTEGKVSSSRLRMKCLVDTFSGSESTIPFAFDSTGMSEGESFKGEFRIISNQGEYLIPYDISIGNSNIDTSMGDIRNLFHFTNLARTNWNEAVELFCQERFVNILNGSDRMYLNIYKTLSKGHNKEQCLEEFLLKIKKKQPVEFIVDDPNVRIDSVLYELSKKILINRNGWGYSHLFISATDDFIVLEKDELTEEDFIGNCARFSYSIIEEKLHEGRNYGQIILRNAYNDIHINICVMRHPVNRMVHEISRSANHETIDLMQYYEAFRCKKISASTWMQETGKIVENLKETDPDNIYYALMHAQLLLTMERYNEARWILEQNEHKIEDTEDDTLYCYYQYLRTLAYRNEADTDAVSHIIEDIYSRNKANWRIGWLLLYTSEVYAKSYEKRWEFLKELFALSANSPVLYIEAYQIIVNNSTVLTELSGYEIQLLKYIAKKELLTPDIIEQFVYLFDRNRIFKKSMIPLMKECYRVLPEDNVLKALCTLLINLNVTDNSAFEWYEKAIIRGLKITRLYEYYMLSINMDEIVEIPKIVLMYFSFDSSLDIIHNSFLYAYVYRNKALYEELYDSYKQTIERFVSFEILKGNNNKYLSYLYKNMITESMVTPELSRGVFNVIFTHHITFRNKNIKNIIIRYENIDTEYAYPVSGKDIYVPICGSEYQIIVEDDKENYFVREEEYSVERLMVPDKIAGYIEKHLNDEILFDMWVCQHGREFAQINTSNVSHMQNICDSLSIDDSVRKNMRLRLIRFYYEQDMIEELDSVLENIEVDDIEGNAFAEVLKMLVVRGMFEKAYKWISVSGGEKVEAKVISRLCSRLLQERISEVSYVDEDMLALSHRAFQAGKYDEVLLQYLVSHFSGTTRELKEIWKQAKNFGMDTVAIEKRILEQYLFTNAYIGGFFEIVKSYSETGNNNEIVKAVLAQQSFDYFVCDKIMEDGYISIMQSFIDEGLDIPYVCKLAYTKYYSDAQNDTDERVNRTLSAFLREIIANGMFFSYFKEYSTKFTFMHRFLDKTFVEYKSKEGKEISIHYMMEKQGHSEGEYLKEEMKDMFYGIYVKMFVLFFGEKMQYYIVEEDDENGQLTQSGTFTRSDMDEKSANSKYSMINDIVISRTLGDYGTMDNLLEEYYRYEYLINTIFNMSE